MVKTRSMQPEADEELYTCAYTRIGKHARALIVDGEMWLFIRLSWLNEVLPVKYAVAVKIQGDASFILGTDYLAITGRETSTEYGRLIGLPIRSWDVQGKFGDFMRAANWVLSTEKRAKEKAFPKRVLIQKNGAPDQQPAHQ